MDQPSNSIEKIFPLLLALIGIGLYAANIADPLRSDDFVSIVGAADNPVGFFTGQATGGSPFYRPLTLLSFWFDRMLWGLWPIGYHLTNLLLFGGVLALFFKVVRSASDSAVIALVATAVLALHPAHADCVAWASGRNELICALFSLGSIYAFLRFKARETGGWWLYGLSVLALIPALLGKENALLLPLVLVAFDLLSGPNTKRKSSAFLHAPNFFIVLGFLAVRTSILGGIGGYGEVHLRMGLFVVRNFIRYVQYFLFPVDLSSNAAFFIQYQTLFLAIFVLSVGGFLFLFRKRVSYRTALLGIAVALLFFLPIGNLFPHNRHALTMNLGLSIFIATLAGRRYLEGGRNAKIILTILLCWLTLLAGFSIRSSAIAGRASLLADRIVKDAVDIVDRKTGPVNLLALTIPDTYKGAFVMRNGLHHALHLRRPDRPVIARRLCLVGLTDIEAAGLNLDVISGVRFEVHLPENGGGYLLLPDAIWSRHEGQTFILGPVGYRITDENPLFRVHGIEMSIDEDFLSETGTVLTTYHRGRLAELSLED